MCLSFIVKWRRQLQSLCFEPDQHSIYFARYEFTSDSGSKQILGDAFNFDVHWQSYGRLIVL